MLSLSLRQKKVAVVVVVIVVVVDTSHKVRRLKLRCQVAISDPASQWFAAESAEKLIMVRR